MKNKSLISILNISMILVFCGVASGVEKKRIAVLPFNTKNVSQVTGEIVRDIIEVELISSRSFTVLERDQIDLILKEQKIKSAPCDETTCAYKYGKALSIDYMVIGKVMKLKNYVVSLRLIDVRKQVVLSAEKLKTSSVQDLEEVAETLAENFLYQLGKDNPVTYQGKIRKNRSGSITQTFYFQYTSIPCLRIPRFDLPDSYGAPVQYKPGEENVHAVGGGTSTSVAIFPWLSLRGDFSVGYFFPTEFLFINSKGYTDASFYTDTRVKIRHLAISGDFLVQFNWLWKYLKPHVALGIGYSYYRALRDDWEMLDSRYFTVRSLATDTRDSYQLNIEYRKNFIYLVGDVGLTFFFNNLIGLTYSCSVRYAPKQPFFKDVSIEKTTAEIIDSDPINDIYKDLDEKLAVRHNKADLTLNLRFGITFRML